MIPPELQLSPSRIARRFFVGLHLLVLAVSLTLPWPWMVLALLATGGYYFRFRSLLDEHGRLQVLSEGEVLFTDAKGAAAKVRLLPASLVTAHLLVLQLGEDKRRRSLVIWPDSADPASLRAWRVWLRWTLPAMQRRIAAAENSAQE